GDRRRHHATASGHDHCRRNGVGTLSAGPARRPALAATLLHADWWIVRSNIHHAAFGACTVFNFRNGLENSQMGDKNKTRADCRAAGREVLRTTGELVNRSVWIGHGIVYAREKLLRRDCNSSFFSRATKNEFLLTVLRLDVV